MKRVITVRLVAYLAAAALGGCTFYGWPHWGTPGYDTFPFWSEWSYHKVEYAGYEPPPMPIEVIPDSPGPGYVWIEGHWHWQDGQFSWVHGSWQMPPPRTSLWVAGRWDYDSHAWYYIEGHWS